MWRANKQPNRPKKIELTVVTVFRLQGARFFGEKSVLGWQVSAKIGVRLIP